MLNNTNTANNENNNINFMKEYLLNKKEEEKAKANGTYVKFFDKVTTDESTTHQITNMRKEIEKLQSIVNERIEALNTTISETYEEDVDLIDLPFVLRYHSDRGDGIPHYYDLNTGLEVDDVEDESYSIRVSTKNSEFAVPIGFIWKKGSLLIKVYKASINAQNTKANIKLVGEILYNIMEWDTEEKFYSSDYFYSSRFTSSINSNREFKELRNIFFTKMFGREGITDISLGSIRSLMNNNVNFETIVKCAPLDCVEELVRMEKETQMPIHRMVGVSKPTYDKLVENGNLLDVLKKYVEFIRDKEKFNVTEDEWLELISKNKDWESDLAFYDITFTKGFGYEADKSALKTLANRWENNYEIFSKGYTFPKFCDYVVNATIDQGFTNLADYADTLRDYITMAIKNGDKPIYETNNLKQTHDVATRNYKIEVSEEDEKKFEDAYNDFHNYIGKEYVVIAPKVSSDLQKEGNSLNHCIASYIRRVIKGECQIVFLRHKDTQDESLVTVEIKDGTISQHKGKHNRPTTEEENKFLKEFAKARNYKFC